MIFQIKRLLIGETKAGTKWRYTCVLFCFWLFSLWMFSKTPYGIDDWSWGIPKGKEYLITGSLNGRYLGNLLEIIVSRSELLKTVIIGTMAALLPALSVELLLDWEKKGEERIIQEYIENGRPVLLLAACLLYMTIPMSVWRQTYGWIAGFSNFGLSAVLILVYQLVVLQLWNNDTPIDLASVFALLTFGVAIELVLENVSIYFAITTLVLTICRQICAGKRSGRLLLLLMGNFIGIAMMFSSSIYSVLFETGHAINGMRAITFDRNAGFLANMLLLNERFIYFFPVSIWANNWIICGTAALIMAINCTKEKTLICYLLCGLNICFVIYIFLNHSFGPPENYISRWSDVLSQRLNLLYFWIIMITIIILYHKEKRHLMVSIFLWFSAPAVIFPLSATNMNAEAGRCFLPSTVFQIEFLLLQVLNFTKGNDFALKKRWGIVLAVLLFGVCLQKGIIYHEIGIVKQEREKLINSAKRGETEYIAFPDFPYLEYLWVTEPVGEEQRNYFREFYDIPKNVEISFNTGESYESLGE